MVHSLYSTSTTQSILGNHLIFFGSTTDGLLEEPGITSVSLASQLDVTASLIDLQGQPTKPHRLVLRECDYRARATLELIFMCHS
jgi:hypothetical protein